ncbi:MAG: hypothetical protein ACR2JY_22635 [Chloroflexota bacterium]
MVTSPGSHKLPANWLAPPVGNRACDVHPFVRAEDHCDRCGYPFCAVCLPTAERWRICTARLVCLQRERRGLAWR